MSSPRGTHGAAGRGNGRADRCTEGYPKVRGEAQASGVQHMSEIIIDFEDDGEVIKLKGVSILDEQGEIQIEETKHGPVIKVFRIETEGTKLPRSFLQGFPGRNDDVC